MCDSLRQDPQDAVSDDVGQEAALAARIPAEPDITLARLQDWLGDRHDGWLSSGGLWAAVKRLGFTFKKTRRRASRCGRTLPRAGLGGARPSRSLIPSAWPSSMKRASIPR
ncbi:MAG: winged helix-turn-helix domain-containing protein [Rhodospirillales bacterium]|nr:winged helix-turn-helix domain-containing protein [Rhodospirillales bacterium]